MYGAIIGDIVGSKYEFNNIKTKNFPLFSDGCDYTDDTIMTMAVAKALVIGFGVKNHQGETSFQDDLIKTMQEFGRRYPHPKGAYGGSFSKWLQQQNPQPYGSYGNGSAMRVSPCGLMSVTVNEAKALARASASVTHNHPEGIKGAEAVAVAVFLAKSGYSQKEIRQVISRDYYDLSFTLNSIRDDYSFDSSCQGSVPQAIVAFLESNSFEEAIRNAISIGGDCDTTAAIAGSIAWPYYAVQSGKELVYDYFDESMLEIKKKALSYLPPEFIGIINRFYRMFRHRAESYKALIDAGKDITPGNVGMYITPEEEKKFLIDWQSPWTSPSEEIAKLVSEINEIETPLRQTIYKTLGKTEEEIEKREAEIRRIKSLYPNREIPFAKTISMSSKSRTKPVNYVRMEFGAISHVYKLDNEKHIAYRLDKEKNEWREDDGMYPRILTGSVGGTPIDMDEDYPYGEPYWPKYGKQ